MSAGVLDNVTYKRGEYDERFRCYFITEYTNGTPTYLYKGYRKGNKITLYPHKALFTTNARREKIEKSIFEIGRE